MNRYRFLLTLPIFLLVLLWMFGAMRVVNAAEINGKVIATRGDSLTIKIDTGPTPRVGDKVEISFGIGEDKVPVGIWHVTSIEGSIVSADVESKYGDATLDMNATIYSSSAVLKQPQREKQNSTTSVAKDNEELFWLKPKERSAKESTLVREKQIPPTPANVEESTVAYAPPPASGAILHMTTNQYEMIWKDSGSGARKDFASFRPIGPPGYYPLGDIAIAEPWRGKRYAMPNFNTILVKNGAMKLKKPTAYKLTWNSKGSRSDAPFSSWKPVAPPGYRCLGDVGSPSLDSPPATDAIRCLPYNCVQESELGERIWRDKGSGATVDFSAWSVPQINIYIGTPAHSKPGGSIYTINPVCLGSS